MSARVSASGDNVTAMAIAIPNAKIRSFIVSLLLRVKESKIRPLAEPAIETESSVGPGTEGHIPNSGIQPKRVSKIFFFFPRVRN